MYTEIRYTLYRCPSCGKRLESRVVTSPRVGREHRDCPKCGYTYRTPDREWRNMTKGQRRDYFLSEWVVGWLGVSVLGGIILSEGSRWVGAIFGLVAGIILCAPSWLLKLRRVRRSRARSTASASLPD